MASDDSFHDDAFEDDAFDHARDGGGFDDEGAVDATIGDHYERWIGPIASAHGISGSTGEMGPTIFVCYSLDAELQVFASDGLTRGTGVSQEALLCTTDLEDPLEHMFGASAGGALGAATQVLVALRELIRARGRGLEHDEIVRLEVPGEPREWYVTRALYLSEKLDRFDATNPPTEVFELIRLCEGEAEWIRANGGRAFRAHFDDIDAYDPGRPSIFERA